MIGRVKKFFSEFVVELQKVSWPTRSELLDSTWVIIISSTFLGVVIAIIDFTLSKFLGLIIR